MGGETAAISYLLVRKDEGWYRCWHGWHGEWHGWHGGWHGW